MRMVDSGTEESPALAAKLSTDLDTNTVQRGPVRTRHLNLQPLNHLADDEGPSSPKIDLRHEWVENEGVRLHVVRAGEGPAVVLLHGFPENSQTWKHQIPALVSAGYSVIAPDLRGYNESDRPTAPGAYHLKHLVADVAAIIRASGHTRANIVGHDWGGILAWTFAGACPEMVDTLVVMNAPHRAIYQRELRPFSRQFFKAWYVLLFLIPVLSEWLLSAFNFTPVRYLFRRVPALPAFTDAEIEAYVAALATRGALTAALRWYRDNTDEESARLSRSAKTAAPTLVVWGMRDSTLVPELLNGLERYAPLVRVHKIDPASHWVQNEAPAEVNQALVEFLEGHRHP